MAIDLRKIDYNINIANARPCLTAKRAAAQQYKGVASASCCCSVSYLDREGNAQIAIGISRGKIAFTARTGEQRAACAHGELTALWDAIETFDGIPTILELYIEMSPCPKCRIALDNILPDGTIVYYSFVYETEKAAWATAALALCS